MAEPSPVVTNPVVVNNDKSAAKAMAIVQELLRDYHPRNFRVELWDGTRLDTEPGQFCRFTWRINHASRLRAALNAATQVALGEAYIYNDFDISGDILAIFPVAEYLAGRYRSPKRKLHLATLLLGLPSRNDDDGVSAKLRGKLHSKSRDQQAISFHYDVSNEFYQLWLDPAMVYSCAYFKSLEDDLEKAQAQKLDYICRKLRLRPGERLLDIGCGWGGLLIYAAQHYGVVAHGITLSPHQAELARKRIQKTGLEKRCHVEICDYREVTKPQAYDKV